MAILQKKRKWTRNRLKCLRIRHLHLFFFRKISRGSPWTPSKHFAKRYSLTHPHHRSAPKPRGWSSTPSGSRSSFWIRHWQCKLQLSLSEFKRLYLHSRLHHFASFFQNFLGGGPPNPHQREGTPSRTLPTRPFRGLEINPPEVDFWIRHWLTHVFTIEKFYEKMRLTLDIYTYRFSFYFQNYSVLWNTIVTFMKVVLKSIFTPSSEAPPPGNFEKITSKWCILSAFWGFN